MKEAGRMFWSLVMAWFLMMGFSNAPLLAKGEGKDKGDGQAKQQKGEKKAKKEKQQKAPKTQIVVPQRRVRIYSPPSAGSIQKDARTYHYIYYPDITMYYNRDTNRYFWLQNGNWVSAHTIPDWARVKNLPRVELDEYYLTPYADHPWVTQSFPTGPEVTGVVVSPRQGNGPPAHAPAYGYRRKYNYNYYPQANVYYNVETKRYFWIEGGSWGFGIEVPKGMNLDDTKKTTMVLGSPFPY